MSRPDFDPTGTLRVLGFPYAVSCVGEIKGKQHTAGILSETRQEIQILRDQRPDAMAETTLHEIIHAVEFATSADMKERQVCALSRGLYAVCRDNPEFMKALLFG